MEFKQELKINLVVTLVSKTQAMEILKMVDIKKVSSVAWIFALSGVARLAEITVDIDAVLRALDNTKIHSNAARSIILTVSMVKNGK